MRKEEKSQEPGCKATHDAVAAGRGLHSRYLWFDHSRPPATQAYAGRVRGDIDHEALKPAAWRVDGYLDGVEEEDLSLDALRGHRLAFPKAPDPRDRMARRDDGDDLVVCSS